MLAMAIFACAAARISSDFTKIISLRNSAETSLTRRIGKPAVVFSFGMRPLGVDKALVNSLAMIRRQRETLKSAAPVVLRADAVVNRDSAHPTPTLLRKKIVGLRYAIASACLDPWGVRPPLAPCPSLMRRPLES